MRIAIVGAGIAGLTCAHLLHPEHEITVFEADDAPRRPHAHSRRSRPTRRPARGHRVHRLQRPQLPRLRAPARAPRRGEPGLDMSFSVSDGRGEFEYNGASANGLFARRSSVLRPSFHRMVRDLMRFNREAPALVGLNGSGPTLLDFLDEGGYSREFVERLIVPQASAVWSADPRDLRHFPASLLAEFFDNHGMFGLSGRPQLAHRARRLDALRRSAHRAAWASGCGWARRSRAWSASPGHVEVTPAGGSGSRRFDEVILAGPLRPVAGACWPTQPGRGRAARRDPLPAQRRRPAHRRLAAAAPPARLGELELPPPGRARRADHCHLPHEPPPVARRRARVLRHAEPREAIDPAQVIERARVRPPRVHARRPGGAAALARDQRRAPHALLRRVLGLRLPRGRGAERRARVRELRGEAVRAVRGLGAPPPLRRRAAQLPLPALHDADARG